MKKSEQQNEITLTIMLTSFNCEKYVDNAIQSVFNQYIPFSWELLIGDDCSNDGTLEAAMKWQKRYPSIIKVYSTRQNEKSPITSFNASLNRRNLLVHARGKYLAFLDGDDALTGKMKFFNQITLLEMPQFNNCSCSAHDLEYVDLSCHNKIQFPSANLSTGIIDSRTYWKQFYFHTNTIIFRSSCINSLLDERYKYYLNDNLITYLIIQHGDILYLDEAFAVYNITGSGIWTGQNNSFNYLRNVSLYDLEREINPSYKSASFYRHSNDFWYFMRNECKWDQAAINLMSNQPKSRFPLAWFFFDQPRPKYSFISNPRLSLQTILCKVFARLGKRERSVTRYNAKSAHYRKEINTILNDAHKKIH